MTTDLTRGNPLKLILFFSIPLLIGNIFQQLYNMADTVIVGRTIGVGALAAVGATGTISYLALGFITGLTAGFSVVTAQRFGAGDEDGVRKSFAAAIVLSVLFTAVMTAVLVVTARPMLEFLDTPEDIIDDSHSYILTIFIGLFATTLFNLLSNMIRALGDSRTPPDFSRHRLCDQHRPGFRADPHLSHGRSRRRHRYGLFPVPVRCDVPGLHVEKIPNFKNFRKRL